MTARTNSRSARAPTHALRRLTTVVGMLSTPYRTARYGSTAILMISAVIHGLSIARRADSATAVVQLNHVGATRTSRCKGAGADSLVLKVTALTVGHLEKVIEQLGRHGTPTTSIILSSPVAKRPVHGFPEALGDRTRPSTNLRRSKSTR